MKKWIAFLLAALLALCVCAALADTCGDYKYEVGEDGTAVITGYNGDASAVEIPAELDGHKVTGIGEEAFYSYISFLTSITLPDSVTSIGDYAFDNCRNLTSITLPDSVTSIGANPFRNCDKLTISVSQKHPCLAVIDGVLFSKPDKRLVYYPVSLSQSSYVVPDGILSIGDSAFSKCENLTNITLTDSVKSIGIMAFYSCSKLKSITLSNSLTSIGNLAFA